MKEERPSLAPRVSERLVPFGTSIFTEMTRLALERSAVNLSQGYPDFDGPPALIESACAALRSGENQYARSMGHLTLARAVSARVQATHGLCYDPEREVVVTSGATEAIASTILALLDPGDEVILLEPFYDSYPACVALAGGVARFTTLRAPRFELDLDELRGLFTPRTRLLVLNTPHNPTGKVYTREELQAIADLAQRHGIVVLSDEVYEHLTFGEARHVPIASLPGMRERTITVSSAGKTFSVTGWKIGWVTGDAALLRTVQAAHQFVTFATATPLQLAVAGALGSSFDSYLAAFRAEYTERRDLLLGTLREAGFDPFPPDGTYFILSGFSRLSSLDDRSFARELIEKQRVATIPPSVFYSRRPEEGRKLLRFTFCKRRETLLTAAERLRLVGRNGGARA